MPGIQHTRGPRRPRVQVLKSATTKQQKLPGSVALICAGTADVTVVEECRLMVGGWVGRRPAGASTCLGQAWRRQLPPGAAAAARDGAAAGPDRGCLPAGVSGVPPAFAMPGPHATAPSPSLHLSLQLASCGCYAFKLAESGVMGMHRIVQVGRAQHTQHAPTVGALHAARFSLPQPVLLRGLEPAATPDVAATVTPTRPPPQNLDAVKAADVVICITGMDGGLASVVAGMVEVPVIALPTSTGVPRACLPALLPAAATGQGAAQRARTSCTREARLRPAPTTHRIALSNLTQDTCARSSCPAGYGTAFSGVAPMLAALNSSAPGVTVVNIDSGFGASMAAWRILQNALRIRKALTKA